nr:energy-coupling factor transporter transmembrane component T [Ardenticatena sp.]
MPFHPYAWLAWCAAAVSATLLTRNPFYLTLALLAVLWVRSVLVPNPEGIAAWLLRWGWLFIMFAALFNGLTIHYGEHVLLRLPASWPLIGGAITAEAILFGALTGVSLMTLLLIFTTFNDVSDYAELLRLTPGFLFHAGLVVSIALSFVPQTVRAYRDVREAQMIRGHRMRSWRDVLPLLLPLLIDGLERAIQLAEALESRGFGGRALQGGLRARLALLAGLMLLLLGLGLHRLLAHPVVGLGMSAAGLLLLLWGFFRLNRAARRTRFHRRPWHDEDKTLLLISLGVLAVVWSVALFDPAALAFYPYPRLSMPPFETWLGVAYMGVAAPAFWKRSESA